MKLLACSLIAVTTLIGQVQSSLACDGKPAIVDEHFENDSRWLFIDPDKIANGSLQMNIDSGLARSVFLAESDFDAFDACVDLSLKTGKGDGGISFQVGGASYVFNVNVPDKTAWVALITNDDWKPVINDKPVQISDSIRLRLTVKGTRAVAFVGDQQIGEFQVKPKKGFGRVGLGIVAGTTPVSYEFRNLKIARP